MNIGNFSSFNIRTVEIFSTEIDHNVVMCKKTNKYVIRNFSSTKTLFYYLERRPISENDISEFVAKKEGYKISTHSGERIILRISGAYR